MKAVSDDCQAMKTVRSSYDRVVRTETLSIRAGVEQ